MIFTMWVCYLKVGTKPKNYFKNFLIYGFYACIIYVTLGISGFLFLQFTPIPLVYLQIEKSDKIPHVNVHRVKYEQFPNLIDKIHFFFTIFYFSFIAMTNLPSVSYMICQFQNAVSGRKTEKGDKSFMKL